MRNGEGNNEVLVNIAEDKAIICRCLMLSKVCQTRIVWQTIRPKFIALASFLPRTLTEECQERERDTASERTESQVTNEVL